MVEIDSFPHFCGGLNVETSTDLSDALEALTLLFADGAKMVNPRTQNTNLHSSVIAAWDWSK